MALCTTNLGLNRCNPDPFDPEAIRRAMELLNRIADFLAELMLGGRPLLNSEGQFIRNSDGTIIRVPWRLPPPWVDLPGLWVEPGGAGEGGSSVPSGGIIAWSGFVNTIPTGWALCDGNNSTPDLREHFIRGAGSGAYTQPGVDGGESTHGAGTNDHTEHAAPAAHTGELTHDTLSAHGPVILTHSGLTNHTEDFLHERLGNHDPHYPHYHEVEGAAIYDAIGGHFVTSDPEGNTIAETETADGHVHKINVGKGTAGKHGDTSDENHDLVHRDHHPNPLPAHKVNFSHSSIDAHAFILPHEPINDHVLSLTHTFDGSHTSTDNEPPFMSLCFIMKLGSEGSPLPRGPFN